MLSHDNLIYTDHQDIRPYDLDASNVASPQAIIQIMHTAAFRHIHEIKLSAADLAPLGLGWVMLQQGVEFNRTIRFGEKLKVETRVAGRSRAFTYRDFYVFDTNDQLVAQTASSWVLFDTVGRRISPYPENISGFIDKGNALPHLPRPERFRLPEKPAEITDFKTVRYYDLDTNGHLSNFQFTKWMLDSLPGQWHEQNRLTALNVRYNRECRLNDNITFQAMEMEDDAWGHRVLHGEDIVATGISRWQKKTG